MSGAVAIIDELLEPVTQCLTPEVAQRLVGLRASAEVQHKLDEYAERSSAGTLTPAERADYETCLRALNFIGVLQAKARRLIANATAT